ncbi:MAG TPA: hypothetical protein VKA46_26395 [Gemmataceae bacterium]|nr:hypothetical protein [Gemmataceae bacterium]
MFLTGEGALLALALALLVCGLLGGWALLRLGVRKPGAGKAPRDTGKVGNVRRVVVPVGTTPKL